MEELPGRGSRRPSRGDRLKKKSGCRRSVAGKVVVAEIVGRRKKRENRYFSGGQIFF